METLIPKLPGVVQGRGKLEKRGEEDPLGGFCWVQEELNHHPRAPSPRPRAERILLGRAVLGLGTHCRPPAQAGLLEHRMTSEVHLTPKFNGSYISVSHFEVFYFKIF